MSDTPIDRARALLILRETLPVLFADSMNMCDQMADVLQEMVDEVERHNEIISGWFDISVKFRERAEAAEARLRELASAEPVAWGLEAEIDGKGWAVQLPVCPTEEDAERDRQLYGHPASLRAVALILRPEMPS